MMKMLYEITFFGKKIKVIFSEDGHFRDRGGKSYGQLVDGAVITGILEPVLPKWNVASKKSLRKQLDAMELPYSRKATKSELYKQLKEAIG